LKRFVAVLYALVLAYVPFACAQEPDHEIHEQLRTVLKEVTGAINAGQYDKMLPYLAENVEATSITQEVMNNRADVAKYFQEWFGPTGYMRKMTMTLDADKLTEFSPDKSWGLVRGKALEHYEAKDGDVFDFVTRWTAVMARGDDNKWRLRAIHFGTNNLDTTWGTALGVLVSWEPFDFGLRRANLAVASALEVESEASLKRTQYEIAVATADAFLTLAAAQETIRTAQAGVDRAGVLLRTITAQVNAQLRPGADASRADAELAAARTQWIQAQQAADVARATLGQFVGAEPAQIALDTSGLLKLPPEQDVPAMDPAKNPVALEQNAAVEETQARLHALERSYFPRFYLQGAAYTRGSGAETNGRILGGLNGLAPNVQNYALGFTVTFPVSDLPSIRAREAAQTANVRSQQARSAQISADLRAQWNRAVAMLTGEAAAREVDDAFAAGGRALVLVDAATVVHRVFVDVLGIEERL